MNSNSQETLCRIEQNDAQFTQLQIGYSSDGGFISSDASDYSRLGAAIGNNTHLTKLVVKPVQTPTLDATNTEFFNGLRRNLSIRDLTLYCYQHILVGGIGHEILKSYQKINNNLTCLCITDASRNIHDAVLDSGEGNVITETLRWCTNLKSINLARNRITDEQLLPIVDAIRGHSMLEELILYQNRIGNAGCHALATLLENPNSNIQTLDLETNQIDNEGAAAIANSLANNTNLKILDLNENPFEPSAVGIFCTVLCNASSVNDTYRSNHTLKELLLSDEQQGQHADHLDTLIVRLNRGENKNHVAIRKILKYHPNIDMEPLFEWDSEGEQTLKALPHVISWFDKACWAVLYNDDKYNIAEKKLSAIFQFAKAMPLLLVPASNIKEDDKKRKRIDI